MLILLTVSAFAKTAPSVFKDSGELKQDIDEGKTIMFIFPHPDDEVFVSGTIALVGGDKGTFCYVCCLGSLDNVRRENIDIPSRLKAIRWLDKTYLKDYLFLDNNFKVIAPKMANEMKKQVVYIIEQKKPDIIVTFSPSGYDGNKNHSITSKIVTDIYPLLSYRPKLYFVINLDQELSFKVREYRKYPPTDIIDLNAHSEKLGKKLWDAKLGIWEKYSDSTAIIMGVMARKQRLDNNDHKEYFRKAR
jgi:LmbE family N-acetylglucosaminyl deacetylase